MKVATLSNSWDLLHNQKRFLPQYPNESVVRFIFKNYPKQGRKNIKIIDLGCGGGRHILFLAKEGFAAYGTDISMTGLSHTRKIMKRAGLKCVLKKSPMEHQPFRDSYFDGVIACGVLYYNDSQGYKRTIDEIRRIVKDGGKALIVTRTTSDYRAGKGKKIENNTYKLSTGITNEKGMPIHFLDRRSIDRYFKDFSTIEVNKIDFTIGDIRNSDWVITVRK